MVLMLCEFQRIKNGLILGFDSHSNPRTTPEAIEDASELKTRRILAILHACLLLAIVFVVIVLIVLRAHYSIGKIGDFWPYL